MPHGYIGPNGDFGTVELVDHRLLADLLLAGLAGRLSGRLWLAIWLWLSGCWLGGCWLLAGWLDGWLAQPPIQPSPAQPRRGGVLFLFARAIGRVFARNCLFEGCFFCLHVQLCFRA